VPKSNIQKKSSNPRGNSPRGRSGGRAGGAGYDFQDVYIAWQLSKMLMGDRDPIVEVLWEKKEIDFETGHGSKSVHVDDSIVKLRSGKWVFTQIKETVTNEIWSVPKLISNGVINQLWKQWKDNKSEFQNKVSLQFASNGRVAPLAIICDAALRSRTISEFIRGEATQDSVSDLKQISTRLSISNTDPDLLEFLKVVHAVQLPDVEEMYGWIVQTLRTLGLNTTDFANSLIRIVTESKHVSTKAKSDHTFESLICQLLDDGIDRNILAAAGFIVTGNKPEIDFWKGYRAELVKSLRTLRVYGLDIATTVYADLPSLYVPLKLLPLEDREKTRDDSRPHRRSLIEALDNDPSDHSDSQASIESAIDLKNVLEENRRFVLVGMQGCGKTMTLRWLATISALEDEAGCLARLGCGLPEEPLIPIFIRFRRLAERIEALKRHGIRGRVGLVADFLSAEFQVGFGTHILSEQQSLRVAYDLLESQNTILLFDALDEVADETLRYQLLQAVTDLLEKYTKPRVVLSSRPYALLKGDLQVNLPRFTPLPLDIKDTNTFCHNWYNAVRIYHMDQFEK